MRIKVLFYILVLFLVAIGGLLFALASTASNTLFFYLVEGFILFILIYLIFFYRRVVKPIQTISGGMDLLREQDFSSRLSKVGQVEADHLVEIFNRMMDQMKNERIRLREQNHFLDLLIAASPMGVLLLSLDGEVMQYNSALLRMMGVTTKEMDHKKLSEIDAALATELNQIKRGETTTVRLNDANIYKCTHSSFIDHGFPHSFFLIESLTQEIIKAEKVAYEKVIRMIAHEVNNSTAGITSTLDTVNGALTEIPDTEEIREVMQICIERCYSMSQFIMRFAEVVKIPEPHLAPVDVNELAATCTRFMEGMCAERNITLKLETVEMPNQQIDVELFEQALLNVIKNAMESIEKEGEIIVRTTLPASIEVIDNGKGISKESEEKIFTPFYSTKPNGQGIGLIFIREVLTRHGCTFSLHTYADGLTRFRILF